MKAEVVQSVSATTSTGIAGAVFLGLTIADWALLIGIGAGLLSISLSIRRWCKEW